jgi:hypothetical protein
MAKRPTPTAPIDEDLLEIGRWHREFLDAHRTRLRDAGLDADTQTREFAAIAREAEARREKLIQELMIRRGTR